MHLYIKHDVDIFIPIAMNEIITKISWNGPLHWQPIRLNLHIVVLKRKIILDYNSRFTKTNMRNIPFFTKFFFMFFKYVS